MLIGGLNLRSPNPVRFRRARSRRSAADNCNKSTRVSLASTSRFLDTRMFRCWSFERLQQNRQRMSSLAKPRQSPDAGRGHATIPRLARLQTHGSIVIGAVQGGCDRVRPDEGHGTRCYVAFFCAALPDLANTGQCDAKLSVNGRPHFVIHHIDTLEEYGWVLN
jgi:hypothetical protein